MNFHGKAIKLQIGDIKEAAESIGVEEATLNAVFHVETGGSGFDSEGRPKALFERHVFYRTLQNEPDKLQKAIDAGLAYPKWGEKPYPKTSDGVYAEIQAASEIDLDCALRATSWGLGQIMGGNYKLVGCNSVVDMVQKAMESEKNQLYQMLGFIKANNLVDALQDKNWSEFAKRYNGPAYATNKYDVKLADAYERFS